MEPYKIKENRRISPTEMDKATDTTTKNKIKLYIRTNSNRLVHQTLITFIQQRFNQSEIRHDNPEPLQTVRVLAYHEHIAYHRSTVEAILDEEESMFGVTCSALGIIAEFSYIVSPYDAISWGLLFLVATFAVLVIGFSLGSARTTAEVEALVSILLEQSYRIKESKRLLLILLGTFLLMGIVLSNGYKSVVTSSAVMPFQKRKINSFREANEQNYRMVVDEKLYIHKERN